MFSELNVGDLINQEKLNQALKKLYYTDYFKEVEISFENAVVTIKVQENPIIQEITINGIDKNSLYEKIEELTSKIVKYPFVENKVSDQVVLLKNLLKSYGYYFVELETYVDINPNNTVNLRYNFNLGEIAKIQKINFIGEKIFSDTILRNIILSEEAKFWKFITRNKFLDINRINEDVKRLYDFYNNRGFYDVKIKSTTAVITDENQFELIFNINSGNKFTFDNVQFYETKNLNLNELKSFEKNFQNLQGKNYSKRKITKLIDEINNYTLKNEFVFLNARFEEIVKENNKIDIIIKFDELEKVFVDRINIFGNFITDEKVIRNSLIIDEGDAYNEILFNKSIANLKSLGIFKNVNLLQI